MKYLSRKHLARIACLCAALAAVHSAAAEKQVLWPAAGGAAPVRRFGEKAFVYKATTASLAIDFKDHANSDDYIAINLGPVNLAAYAQGGYVEIAADIDQPLLRITATIAESSDFWGTRQVLEGGAVMQPGARTYRFYLDGVAQARAAEGKDSLYIFIQDLGGKARGDARLKITSVTLNPAAGDWRAEKAKIYSRQYNWPKPEKIEPLYYEELDRGVEWSEVASSPTLARVGLDGEWRKKNFGERTWDYAFLADARYSNPGYDDSAWEVVSTPEPATADQAGGHVWYRREIDVPSSGVQGGMKTYLRFDDIADDARIYLNGRLVGTQTSVEKRLDWVAENGSRHRFGVSVEQGITWQHFDRVGVPFPFDRDAVPKGANRLVLPIYSGQEEWPLAYDVTDLVKPGKNLVAIRSYGNPMRGWWIHRNRSDRSARNVHGILGSSCLAIQPMAVIASLIREPAVSVGADGRATHKFTCGLLPGVRTEAVAVAFRCGDEVAKTGIAANGSASTEISLPARFGSIAVQASVLDAKGCVLETREIVFDGAVIEVAKDRRLLVNGEPFLVRGINASPGVEWDNDRTVTRREFLRMLRVYQQLGLNTLRIESAEGWQLDAAFEHGFMVMPTTAAASTDWSMGVFGQLVEPDLRQAWDRQRLMTIQLRKHGNILLWNGGNELHHTPGYDDRPVLDRYIEGMRDIFRQNDPARRPVTYANLDMLKQNWFFFGGQDVVGWNVYKDIVDFRKEIGPMLDATGGRPVLFTEWGMFRQNTRKENIDTWEKEMRGKWELIANTPGSVGGMIYAWHGEMEDERGREFLRDLMLPFVVDVREGRVILRNRSEAAMRDVRLLVVAKEADVPLADDVAEIPAGADYEARFLSSVPADSVLEIRYETHGGLRHSFTWKL